MKRLAAVLLLVSTAALGGGVYSGPNGSFTALPLPIASGGTGASTLAGAQANLGIGAGGGSGTVTSFSAGTLSPLFTTSVATSTVTPALSFTLSTAVANTLFGNCTGSTATPSFATFLSCFASAFGNGTSGQYLESLGGGSFQWNTPAGGGAGTSATIVTVTTSSTMASGTTDERCNSASALTITLPTSGMVAGQLPYSSVKNVGAGACTVDAGSGNTIDGNRTYVLTQYQAVSLECITVVTGVCTVWDIK